MKTIVQAICETEGCVASAPRNKGIKYRCFKHRQDRKREIASGWADSHKEEIDIKHHVKSTLAQALLSAPKGGNRRGHARLFCVVEGCKVSCPRPRSRVKSYRCAVHRRIYLTQINRTAKALRSEREAVRDKKHKESLNLKALKAQEKRDSRVFCITKGCTRSCPKIKISNRRYRCYVHQKLHLIALRREVAEQREIRKRKKKELERKTVPMSHFKRSISKGIESNQTHKPTVGNGITLQSSQTAIDHLL